jgi:hypothetical protein
MSPTQLRLAADGYGLPLRPEALARLNQFERHHVYACLGLDAGQEACAEAAVAAVERDEYAGSGAR